MENGEYRSFDGEIRVLARESPFLLQVELWLLNDKVTANNWQYVNLAEHRAAFAGWPILVAYCKDGRQIGDGHNFRLVRDDKTGEKVPSFTDATAERIVGELSENEADIRLEQKDGHTWVVASGKLWRWYARELVDKIEQDALQGRAMQISIETLVTQSRMEGEIEIEENYIILGVTILGDHVQPAVAGAKIVTMQQLQEQFKELKLRAASYEKSNKQRNKTNTAKGVKDLTLFSKKQAQELSAKFPGYTVLAAGQNDNGIFVCLLADGCTAIYTMQSLSDTVMPERITKINAQVRFSFGEDCEIALDACELTEHYAARLQAAETERDTTKEELNTAQSKMQAMQTAESARRLQAAKAKAAEVLRAFNANRTEQVADTILTPVLADIEKGVYANCVNAEGAWQGESEVEKTVKALCADSVMAQDAEKNRRNASAFVWEKHTAAGNTDDGSVGALLARKGIR